MKTTKEINARLTAIRTEQRNLRSEEIKLEKRLERLSTKRLAESRAAKGKKVVKVEDIKVGDRIFREGDYKTVIGRESYMGRLYLTWTESEDGWAERSFVRGTRLTIKA
jgi:hypothetical protein